ncbi:hypothetical protein BTVI_00860 [Pitangus sulphuratus]|nr:hypothetical protein BTVI_00860 [Pitangus sulphuratus]
MGASLCKPEKDIYKRIRAVIDLKGHKYDKASLKALPTWIHKSYGKLPDNLTYTDWDHIGELLWKSEKRGDKVAAKAVIAWRLVLMLLPKDPKPVLVKAATANCLLSSQDGVPSQIPPASPSLSTPTFKMEVGTTLGREDQDGRRTLLPHAPRIDEEGGGKLHLPQGLQGGGAVGGNSMAREWEAPPTYTTPPDMTSLSPSYPYVTQDHTSKSYGTAPRPSGLAGARKKTISPTKRVTLKKSASINTSTQTSKPKALINTKLSTSAESIISSSAEDDTQTTHSEQTNSKGDTGAYALNTNSPRDIKPGPWIDVTHQVVDAHEKAWRDFREQAIKAGDTEMLNAFPVSLTRDRAPEWTPISYPLLKDIKKAITDYGLNSPFTIGALDSFFQAYTLIPNDIRLCARAWLPVIQFSAFEVEWKLLVKKYIREGGNLYDITAMKATDRMLGEGEYSSDVIQSRTPIGMLDKSKDLALKAMKKVIRVTTSTPSYSLIFQGTKEPFLDFATCRKEAITKQIAEEQVLFKSLVVERDNAECQRLLKPLKNPTLLEMIESC